MCCITRIVLNADILAPSLPFSSYRPRQGGDLQYAYEKKLDSRLRGNDGGCAPMKLIIDLSLPKPHYTFKEESIFTI